MANPIAYPGRGTQLLYSLDGAIFTAIPQIQQFEPTGGGATAVFVDQTNLSSPGNSTEPLAVQVDGGEMDIAGVLNPQEPSYLALAQANAANTPLHWQAVLVDGSVFSFSAFVSQFKAFSAKWNKIYVWTAKLRLIGIMQSPSSDFDFSAFDPSAFQI